MRCVGPGPFVAQGVTFAHEGGKWADVVDVVGGEVTFQDCRFSGGVSGSTGNSGGAGVRLRGSVAGILARCEMLENMTAGISLREQGQMVVEANICRENQTGIEFYGRAAATARQNRCSGNMWGIYVSDQSQPTLEANICERNKVSGISYSDSAAGAARKNRCTGNMWGIYMSEQAQPTLEANSCGQNKVGDIGYFLDDILAIRGRIRD